MAKINTFNHLGKKLPTTTVSDSIFAAKINPALMTQAVRVYLSNQRQASARTKDRGEIKVTKAKVWRQKGTGRARHGSRNAPIFVGGAKAHGPTGRENFNKSLSKQMRQKSLFSALSQQLKEEHILVVDTLVSLPLKTARFDKLFNKLAKDVKKILFLIDKEEKQLRLATRNLAEVTTLTVTNLNAYQTLKARQLIFTKAAIKALEKHYGSK
jgi:large subunit ribosomal protein L4